MNTLWILTVFLFDANTLVNTELEKKTFFSIEECVAYSRAVIEEKEADKNRPPHQHYTASCIPKND